MPGGPDIEAWLRRHGIKPTQQRIAVARVVFGENRHLSAEAVYEHVNAGDVRVSKATVYNVLGLLVDKGLVRPVIVDPGVSPPVRRRSTRRRCWMLARGSGDAPRAQRSPALPA